MKKMFSIAIIAVICLLTIGACTKKSSSTCTCKAKGASLHDTTFSVSTVTGAYTSLSTECSSADSAYRLLWGASYGCHM